MACGCGAGSCGSGGGGSGGGGTTSIAAIALIAIAGAVAVAMLDGSGKDSKATASVTTPVAATSPMSPTAPPQETPKKESPVQPKVESPYVLDFTMDRIDGTPEKLEDFKGKVVLIVNVASKCGYTRQYAGLESLYQQHKDDGLVVLGFPANNFKGQEPGSNEEIAKFCTSEFNVTFPLFAKISVLGDDQHPLYKKLSAQAAPIGGDPKWNFTKFLVDRSGNVVARYEPATTPDDPALTSKLDELLKAR